MAQSNTVHILPEYRDLISKSDIKTYSQMRVRAFAPDKLHEITQKRLIKALTFMEGYYTSLAETAQPPINIDELKQQVLSIGFQYIWRAL